jgi:CRISPR-associated helicase Cas3
MHVVVETLRYATNSSPFVGDGKLKPYAHQLQTLELVRKALRERRTICIENTSVTGSGKTLANFASAILDGTNTCGVYPTNELMMDQCVSLGKYLAGANMMLLDSQGLDDIIDVHPHMHSHAQALAWATGDDMRVALLTNPDVLYLAMYDLYGQMFSTFSKNFGKRTFQYMLANYPVIAFDEFHLYSAKQIANAAFMMGTARELAPENPHIFIFSSATPQPLFKQYVQRLNIETVDVTNSPSTTDADMKRVVCEPITINFLSADLLRWQGGDRIREHLNGILRWADSFEPKAKGVFIVDSVYEAKRIAAELRKLYLPGDIGEVHGYMAPEERAVALLRRFSVGTTTIDVGVDLTDQKSKEFLVCEARSAAQAIQRIGRLGRHGREADSIQIPNTVWLVVPDYVYQFVEQRVKEGTILNRQDLNRLLNEAYLGHEEFKGYTQIYSPLEAVAASERIQRQYFDDIKEQAVTKLHRLVSVLYGKNPPSEQEEAEKRYENYRKRQFVVWKKYGTEIHNPASKKKYYLSDLESFRGGMESDFTVAIYDDLDERQGFKPIKTYGLPFVVRRTKCEELSKRLFEKLVQDRHPFKANEWLEELERHRNLLGYVHVHSLVEKQANETYFEVNMGRIGNEFERVIRLQGLTVGVENAYDVRLGTSVDSINAVLEKKTLNCWVSERNGFKLGEILHLPPLFAIYPLHARRFNGKVEQWSIAFGLDAFLLASLPLKKKRVAGTRSDNTAIII